MVDLSKRLFAAVAGNVVLALDLLVVFLVLVGDHAQDGRAGRRVVDLDVLDAVLEKFFQDVRGQFRGFFQSLFPDLQLLAEIEALKILVVGLGDLAVADLVEEVKEILVPLEAQGSQKRRGPDSAPGVAAVNADVNVVLEIESGLEPGAAVRNKRETEERNAGGVDVLKVIDAGGALQLADDNAFHAVNYEGSVVRHHGDHAERDILLLDDFFLTEFSLDAEQSFYGHFVSFTAAFAFVNGIFGSAERVMLEIHLQFLVVADDGESLLKEQLQTYEFAFFGHFVLLQELGVGVALHGRQGRQREFAELSAVYFLDIAFFSAFHVVGKL